MTGKRNLLAAVAATGIFWVALLVFAALYPGYTHFNKAISELGAFGAPHALAWNVIGFITPGILLAIAGGGIALLLDGRRTVLFWLLVLSGLGFSGTGIIPAEMSDGSPLMESAWTGGHILMTFVSGLPWIIASVVLVTHVRRNPAWRHLTTICTVLGVCAVAGLSINIVAGALPYLADNPGLAQRLSFAFYFAWFVAVASLFSGPEKRLV